MNKNKILTKPARVAEISFEELYDSFTTDWEKTRTTPTGTALATAETETDLNIARVPQCI